jgi:hypothetical protein
MDRLRNNPDFPLMVTFCLWPASAPLCGRPKKVFWLCGLVFFVGIRVDLWQRGAIETGDLLNAAAGGLCDYLLWPLQSRRLCSNPKGLWP